jgi:hypothetical protein
MRLPGLLLAFACVSFAQTGDGLVTSVTRTLNIAPDQAEFLAVVTTNLDATQSEVVQVFRKIGIQNLTVVTVAAGPNTTQFPQPSSSQVYYGIAFTVAPEALKDFAQRLDSMKAVPPEPLTSAQFSAVLTASPAALEAAHQAVLPSLLAEARSKAQALAQAAGMKLGALQGLSESSYSAPGLSYGFFLPSVISGSLGSSGASAGTQYNFYATVKFAVQ